jgi:hypothetical protein
MRSLVIALMVFVLSSCSSSKVLEKALTTQERAVIHGAIDDIARGDEQSLARKMPPELSAKVLPVMGRMHALLPAPPLEVTLTNANWTTGQAARELHAVYRLHGGRRIIALFRRGDETAEQIDDDAADAAPQSDMP